MSLRELYQQHYFHEIDRKDKINNATAIPLGIISIIIGGVVVVASDLDHPFDFMEKAQILFLSFAATAIFAAIYFLARCYWGYRYYYLPTTSNIKLYHDDLLSYYKTQGMKDARASALAEKEIHEYIENEYTKNTSRNTQNNDLKQSRLFKANGLTISSVLFLALASAPYIYSQAIEPDAVQKIEITNIREFKMPPKENTPQNNKKTPTQEKKPETVEKNKPSPPTTRISLEHLVEPPKNK